MIKLGVRDLGREDLLEDVAKRFGEKVAVDHKKLQVLQLLGCSDVFTTDQEEARIHAVDMRQVSDVTLLDCRVMLPFTTCVANNQSFVFFSSLDPFFADAYNNATFLYPGAENQPQEVESAVSDDSHPTDGTARR